MGINKTLMGYLDKSYSQYHAIALIKERLLEEGFEELEESSSFVLTPGKGYFVIRNDSSLIAFVPEERAKGFRIAASHSDSPTFKIKNDPVVLSSGEACLRVEPYGGMIMSTWMDKPLSIAGRLMVKKGKQIRSELFYINEDVAIIPNLCIHFNRDVNEGHNYNPDVDMVPLIGKLPEGFCWKKYLKEKAGLGEGEEILDEDLFLTVREKSHLIGINKEYLCSPRLDNLTSAFLSLEGFLSSNKGNAIKVYACFDNEEVGSSSRQGAGSSFLQDILFRVSESMGLSYREAMASSFILSIDNAHARHPNYPSTFEKSADVSLNKGIVLKYNANQRYTTDAYSAAIVRDIAKKAKVNVQSFSNRPDIKGGSTLGAISLSQVSIPSADIGLAQLAMHSSFETMGSEDPEAMKKFTKAYFGASFDLKAHEILVEGE